MVHASLPPLPPQLADCEDPEHHGPEPKVHRGWETLVSILKTNYHVHFDGKRSMMRPNDFSNLSDYFVQKVCTGNMCCVMWMCVCIWIYIWTYIYICLC